MLAGGALAGLALVTAGAWVVGHLAAPAAGPMPSPVAGPERSQAAGPTPTLPTAAPASPPPQPTPVPPQPVLGFGASAAEDPPAHQLVVFGGVDSYATTWLWDGRNWSLARPRVSPSGRFGAAAAYDPVQGVVLLFGGRLANGDVVNDTWAWDGTGWRELDAGAGGPPPGELSAMAWDDAARQMVLVTRGDPTGDQTWFWEGGSWLRQPGDDLAAATGVVAMTFDPAAGALLAVSCCPADQGVTTTWSLKGTGWQQLATRGQPAFTVAMALDPTSGRPVLFTDPSLVAGDDVWSWTGEDWAVRSGARPPVFPDHVVDDPTSGALLLLGSFAEPVQGQPRAVHLWLWLRSAWVQRA